MHMKIVDTSVLQWLMNFGHYIFEYDGKSDFADEYSLDKERLTSETEIRVNRFATALLMPKDIFTDKYRLFHF